MIRASRTISNRPRIGPRVRACLLASALPFVSIAVAQEVPPSLRACADELANSRRLACYDTQMARLTAKPIEPGAVTGKPSASVPARASAAAAAPSTAAAPGSSTPLAPTAAANVAAGSTGESSSASAQTGAAVGVPAATAPKGPKELTAHISSLVRRPDGNLILHLDNGQVWEQTQLVSNFRVKAGDSVTISKGLLTSYWLTSPASAFRIRVQPHE